MHALAAALMPLHRAVTGEGLRRSLAMLGQWAPLATHEVPSGTQVFDWQVPREWVIRDAWIEDAAGHRVLDYANSNLHVINYSQPVDGAFTWRELQPHLHSLPECPHWIPYRTAFFHDEWGFCLSHAQLEELAARGGDAKYRVCIDSEFFAGALTYGEVLLPGELSEEVLISAHTCHPSLANDNLSGMVVATFLARHLLSAPRRYTYRFLLAPATIGAIAWLALNQEAAGRVRHGLVLSVLGDNGPLTYKQSRRGNAAIDRAAAQVLRHSGREYSIRPFEPWGYDQRQFCSPGFDLPVGSLMRTPNGEYPQYHTSADDLSFIRPEALADSLRQCIAICDALEADRVYVNTRPMCEPRLSQHGLHQAYGRGQGAEQFQRAVLWVLNLSDGRHSLLDIAERSNLPLPLLERAAAALQYSGLLMDAAEARDDLATLPPGAASHPRSSFMIDEPDQPAPTINA